MPGRLLPISIKISEEYSSFRGSIKMKRAILFIVISVFLIQSIAVDYVCETLIDSYTLRPLAFTLSRTKSKPTSALKGTLTKRINDLCDKWDEFQSGILQDEPEEVREFVHSVRELIDDISISIEVAETAGRKHNASYRKALDRFEKMRRIVLGLEGLFRSGEYVAPAQIMGALKKSIESQVEVIKIDRRRRKITSPIGAEFFIKKAKGGKNSFTAELDALIEGGFYFDVVSNIVYYLEALLGSPEERAGVTASDIKLALEEFKLMEDPGLLLLISEELREIEVSIGNLKKLCDKEPGFLAVSNEEADLIASLIFNDLADMVADKLKIVSSADNIKASPTGENYIKKIELSTDIGYETKPVSEDLLKRLPEMIIGERIEAIIKENGMTTAQVLRKAGIKYSTYIHMKKSKVLPWPQHLFNIFKVCEKDPILVIWGKPWDRFIEDTKDMPSYEKMRLLRVRKGWTQRDFVIALKKAGLEFSTNNLDAMRATAAQWEREIMPLFSEQVIISKVLGDDSLFKLPDNLKGDIELKTMPGVSIKPEPGFKLAFYWREIKGLSVERAAEKIGLAPDYIRYFLREYGKKRVARFYGITLRKARFAAKEEKKARQKARRRIQYFLDTLPGRTTLQILPQLVKEEDWLAVELAVNEIRDNAENLNAAELKYLKEVESKLTQATGYVREEESRPVSLKKDLDIDKAIGSAA